MWDDEFRFHSYSPLADASISIPFFKLWIDVVGVPLELYKEIHMARAVSFFGIYLSSMEPKMHGDCHTWSLFVAIDDLALVPHEIELKIGGMVYAASICPRKWFKEQVYQRSNLPPAMTLYQPPITPPDSPNSSQPNLSLVNPALFQGDDVVLMSLKALREIYKDVSPSQLPEDLVACLADNKEAIEANHRAFRSCERINEDRRLTEQLPLNKAAPLAAPRDLANLSSTTPIATQGATPAFPRLPTTHAAASTSNSAYYSRGCLNQQPTYTTSYLVARDSR